MNKIISQSEITDPLMLKLLEELEILRDKKKIHDLRGRGLSIQLEAIKAEIALRCDHSNIEETSSYYSGSYDETARTFYTHTCMTCGTVVKSWDKSHNHYG